MAIVLDMPMVKIHKRADGFPAVRPDTDVQERRIPPAGRLA